MSFQPHAGRCEPNPSAARKANPRRDAANEVCGFDPRKRATPEHPDVPVAIGRLPCISFHRRRASSLKRTRKPL